MNDHFLRRGPLLVNPLHLLAKDATLRARMTHPALVSKWTLNGAGSGSVWVVN
jgi:hypothetical protein